MKAVRRSNATGAFSWIGSDGWSARDLVSDGNEAEVEGTLSVQPQANPVEGFEDYFLNLTVENNKRNPWFVGEFGLRFTHGQTDTCSAILFTSICICAQGIFDVASDAFGVGLRSLRTFSSRCFWESGRMSYEPNFLSRLD